MLKGILSLETHDYTRAEELLNQAHQVYEQYPFVGIFGCARIMLANLYLQTRKHDEAERVLQMVLNENRQNGTPGIVMWEGYRILGPLLKFALERNIQVEFVRDLMQRLNISADTFEIRPQGAVLPDGAEKLTPREVEILQLLANGYSNQDVADTLVISLHTVKHHVASVLQKLLVSSRTQAVARARELKLV
jgi:LuxR family maltose regulon positive regulatory protein